MQEQIDRPDARTHALTELSARAHAQSQRRRTRRLRIGRWLRLHLWMIALGSLLVPALAWGVTFDRWAAFYPLLIGLASVTLLIAVLDILESGKVCRQSRINIASGAFVAVCGVTLSALA